MKKIFSIIIVLALCIACQNLDNEYETLHASWKDANEYGPITTWEEAIALGKEKIPVPEYWDCEGEDLIRSFTIDQTGDIPIDKVTGYYGLRSITTFTEEVGSGKRWKKGLTLMSLEIDPNNGWIRKLLCNRAENPKCPVDDNGKTLFILRWNDENPNYKKYVKLDTGEDNTIVGYGVFFECMKITEWYE